MSHEFLISPAIESEHIKVISLADEKGISTLGIFTPLDEKSMQYVHLDDAVEFAFGELELEGSNGTFKAMTPKRSGKYCVNCPSKSNILYLKNGKAIGAINLERGMVVTFKI